MKSRFYLWMLKPKSSQSSGCTNIHQTSWKSLRKCSRPARKLMATVFWDSKWVLTVEFMQQGVTIMSEVYCKTLKKSCIGPFRTKVWIADICCCASRDNFLSAYSCSHSSAAGAFQLGVVWAPSLWPWSCFEQLLPLYLPEEVAGITALQQHWGVDRRSPNVAELTGSRLPWHRHAKLIPRYKYLISGNDYIGK
jgi:hypothetical protein